ncbi:MAG: response regulator transcription factor [Ignavibacteriaceae bacterium]|nr:response regulator transcription factor [Ignavibacteriaceae bacterium]MCW9066361.1 response regulator transcription factor [Ignavibacteriaceae bacterium]
MKKVLVIEDDKSIADLLEIHLKDLNCEVTSIQDGEEGLKSATSNPFDLIVLDLMLPKVNGLEICKEVRKKDIYTPILMLTSKSEEMDKVLGLEVGADDYLTKPFSIREFIARAKAILRRVEAIQKEIGSDSDISVSELSIEASKRKVTLNGERIELTPKEFDLLHLLASHPGKTYTREQLLNILWGYQYNGYEHTVNSHINRLRSKIEPDISKPKYILTSWGVGYRFNEEIS